MNIVYYCSDFFAEICGVSIQSLCENNTETEEIVVYIIEDHISEINKKRLDSIAKKYNRKIEYIEMPTQEEVYPGIEFDLGRTYARMALGEILPKNVERVLSLDSDTLIMDSLQEMYDTIFKDEEYVAGVYDCVGSAMQDKVLRAPKDMKYCNAGMFLIDLLKWREKNVGMQLFELVTKQVNEKRTMYFLEQDLMNITFYGHIKLLPARYNLLTSICLFDYDDVIRMKRPVSYYEKQDVEDAKRKPALIHATTCFYVGKRMWVEGSDHPMARKYLEYRGKTPWAELPQISDSRKWSKKIYAKFWKTLPKKMSIGLAVFMINYVRPLYAKVTNKLSVTTIAKQSST